MNSIVKIIVTIFITLILFFSAFSVYQIPSVKETIALATTIKPETFTELYLENHTEIQKYIEVDVAQTFSFTIHNLEHKTMDYPYEVYIEDLDGNKAELVKDIVRLKHDEKRTIPVYFQINVPVKRAKVVVNLTSKDQAIHFWIGEELGKLQASPTVALEEPEAL